MKDMGNRRDKLWWFSDMRKSPGHGYLSLGLLRIERN